jgi:hypothetical protein
LAQFRQNEDENGKKQLKMERVKDLYGGDKLNQTIG